MKSIEVEVFLEILLVCPNILFLVIYTTKNQLAHFCEKFFGIGYDEGDRRYSSKEPKVQPVPPAPSEIKGYKVMGHRGLHVPGSENREARLPPSPARKKKRRVVDV